VGSDQPPSRRMSSYTRPSISPLKSESPNHDSHRNVGEGALDDSDSSDIDTGEKENKAKDGSSDEETGLRPLISPYQSTRVVPTTPSPLSHVAVQQRWSEDEEDGNEDDEASPSPGSTESSSNSSEDNAQRKKRKYSRARRHSHAKSRSRSSTVASLAASSLPKPLVNQGSKGSIRTVIVGDVSVGEPDSREKTVMDVLAKDQPAFSPESQKRQRSQAVSSDMGSNAPEDVELQVPEAPEQRKMMSEKSRLRVVAEETKFREMGWDILRDALRRFADEGDVQMCSMLAVVASQELKVEKRRVARFLESYVGSFRCSELVLKARRIDLCLSDILTHLQLYTSAAYVRKYSEIEDVRAITRVSGIGLLVEPNLLLTYRSLKLPFTLHAGDAARLWLFHLCPLGRPLTKVDTRTVGHASNLSCAPYGTFIFNSG
jgi:WD repeat-containing protein 24